jgi:uncharacterized protein YdiU (UPF0061 family)
MAESEFTIGTFENSFSQLTVPFYARVSPTRVRAPVLLAFNEGLARELSLTIDHLDERQRAELFSGNAIPIGAEPLAAAYAGHQFGQFVPRLGDGRAILLGEMRDHAGQLRDIQLKGAGLTPFSRRGDGRAALGPVLREYLVSEAMHALGVPSTRALAMVLTGEVVLRDGYLPGAVLTRVAASHVRVGSFEYFAAQGDQESLKRLVDYVVARHYPDLWDADNRALSLVQRVVEKQAALLAAWMMIGFVHGVMNTDNMTLSGETIDFGPCAFMEAYHPDTVFSSIDQFGRYAYGRQPSIAQWNLARLAEALLPLIDSDEKKAVERATEAISAFSSRYHAYWLHGMRQKLGLRVAEEDDRELAQRFLDGLQRAGVDFTLAFRRLSDGVQDREFGRFLSLVGEDAGLRAWLAAYAVRLDQDGGEATQRQEAMRRVNPIYIPRNHQVEKAILAAVSEGDLTAFKTMQDLLAHPFEEVEGFSAFSLPAEPSERVYQTFCGT